MSEYREALERLVDKISTEADECFPSYWEEYDEAKVLLARGESVEPAAAEKARELLPAESIALTVALAQVLRGEPVMPNIATVCVLGLARLAGKHDWSKSSPPAATEGDAHE